MLPLGTEVGLGPGHIVLDAPSPEKGNTAPIFGPCLLCRNGWMDKDATFYMGTQLPLPKRGQPLIFRTMSIVVNQTVAHLSYW